jgi:hypothetical protein
MMARTSEPMSEIMGPVNAFEAQKNLSLTQWKDLAGYV